MTTDIDVGAFKKYFYEYLVGNISPLSFNTTIEYNGVLLFGQFTKFKSNDPSGYQIKYTYNSVHDCYTLEKLIPSSLKSFRTEYSEVIPRVKLITLIDYLNVEEYKFQMTTMYPSEIIKLIEIFKFIMDSCYIQIDKVDPNTFTNKFSNTLSAHMHNIGKMNEFKNAKLF